MDYSQELLKIHSDNGIFNNGDKVFISRNALDRLLLIFYKVDDFFRNMRVSFEIVENQSDANVYVDEGYQIIDFFTTVSNETIRNMPGFEAYSPEIQYAVSKNQRIIIVNNLIKSIHKNGILITEDVFNNLMEMVDSNDPDSMNLAFDIVSGSNRDDYDTINYLIKFIKKFDQVLLEVNSRTKDLVTISSPMYELFMYLREVYPERL